MYRDQFLFHIGHQQQANDQPLTTVSCLRHGTISHNSGLPIYSFKEILSIFQIKTNYIKI